MSRLFISHATDDRTFVENELLALLKALGFDVWLAEKDIITAEHWERSILTGLKRSEWFIILLSTKSANSEWVKDELSWAIDNLPDRIVPLLIEDCNVRDFHVRLSRIQVIDYRFRAQAAREKLIECLVQGEYRRRSLSHIVNGLSDCPSKEIFTIVKIEKGEFIQRSTIVRANARADEFFGRRSGETIIGLDAARLFEICAHWMEPGDFKRFLSDQVKLSAAFERGEEIYATVPIKINQKHPVERMRGRRFLPITIAYSYPEELSGTQAVYAVVMYLDLNNVSKAIKDEEHAI